MNDFTNENALAQAIVKEIQQHRKDYQGETVEAGMEKEKSKKFSQITT